MEPVTCAENCSVPLVSKLAAGGATTTWTRGNDGGAHDCCWLETEAMRLPPDVRTTVPTQYAPPPEGWYANVHNGPDLTTPANAAAISCGDLTAAA